MLNSRCDCTEKNRTNKKATEKISSGTSSCHMSKASIRSLKKIQYWAIIKGKNEEKNQRISESKCKGRIREKEEKKINYAVNKPKKPKNN